MKDEDDDSPIMELDLKIWMRDDDCFDTTIMQSYEPVNEHTLRTYGIKMELVYHLVKTLYFPEYSVNGMLRKIQLVCIQPVFEDFKEGWVPLPANPMAHIPVMVVPLSKKKKKVTRPESSSAKAVVYTDRFNDCFCDIAIWVRTNKYMNRYLSSSDDGGDESTADERKSRGAPSGINVPPALKKRKLQVQKQVGRSLPARGKGQPDLIEILDSDEEAVLTPGIIYYIL